MKNRWGYLPAMLLLAAVAAGPVMADEVDELRSLHDTTIELIKMLVQQGVLTKEKADELIRKAEEAGRKSAASASAQPNATAAPGAAALANTPAQPNVPAAATATQPSIPAPVAANPPTQPGNAPPAPAPGQPPVIRVPYVPETVKEEIRDEVEQDVLAQAHQERWGDPGTLPDWLKHVSLMGDVRVRFQGERFPNDGTPNASPVELAIPQFGAWPETNTSEPDNIVRIRARFGVQATLGDTVTAAIRLATGGVGTGANPATENQTLGNYNSHESVGLDLAYLAYHPTSWFSISGGRLGKPFFAPTTLVWANDLSLEGGVISFTPRVGAFDVFATAGAFPILDNEPSVYSSSNSKWLYAYQTGFGWELPHESSFRFGAALYDYRNIQGIPNPTYYSTIYNNTAAPARQGGNSVFDIDYQANTLNGTQNYIIGLASKFDEANLSATLDIATFADKHVILDLDWVRNLGFNHNEIYARTDGLVSLSPQTTGMQERIAFGDTSFARRNSWQAYVGYRHVEADAVVDAFTDSDFHLGGTDATGYYLGAKYAFEKNSTLEVRWFAAKQITGLPLAIDVLQIDAMAAF
jgi:hypothetical protein